MAMALLIRPESAAPCSLEECLAAFDEAGFAPEDAASVNHAANWLARLAANGTFLGQLALNDLRQACQRQGGQGYSPQVMMLGKARRGWFMRANIWPSHEEAVLHDSGEAAFVYGVAHDHNFDFLTVGYHGPGYRSDHYEVDPASVVGLVGERVALRPVGSSVLSPGQIRHYRARRDVHCQHAPASLSVSINLMQSTPSQRWTDQFEYDLASSSIRRVLTGCTGDSLARMALLLDPANARDTLDTIARQHPVDRLRWSAIRALALAEADEEQRREIYAHDYPHGSGWLAQRCRAAIGD